MALRDRRHHLPPGFATTTGRIFTPRHGSSDWNRYPTADVRHCPCEPIRPAANGTSPPHTGHLPTGCCGRRGLGAVWPNITFKQSACTDLGASGWAAGTNPTRRPHNIRCASARRIHQIVPSPVGNPYSKPGSISRRRSG